LLATTGGLAEKDNDRRHDHPRFHEENFSKNLVLLDSLRAVAAHHSATPAQTAIAWLLAQGEDIVPIPGTKHVARLEKNLAAIEVMLREDEIARLERAFPQWRYCRRLLS
jgi:aryl-alcohol dehydrogenase-like predicted oxidoreductase